MTETNAARALAAGEGRTVDLGVARMRVLADSELVPDNQFSLVEFSGDSGGAWTVPHVHHRMTESFYVLEGRFTFTIGKQRIEATPGHYVVVPHDTPHLIEAGDDGGRFLTLMVPGGLEKMFIELAELPGTGITDQATREAVSARYDSTPV